MTTHPDHRVGDTRMPIRRIVLAIASLLALSLVLSACGGGKATKTTGGGSTLRTAFSEDPSPLDPDTYYEAEGLAVTTSVYQRLVRYAPDSNKLIGDLATQWAVSKDGLTYTFTLKGGVKFSDGTAFDAAAAKASLERRIALKAGPSYMLAGVKTIQAPSPTKLVVHLKTPQAEFLSLMASPYGPLMTSPTAVKQHTVKGDNAHKWLSTHSAGTGPYVLSQVTPSVRYVLATNPYWAGPKPFFSKVNLAVIPSFATQRLELEGGQLDVVLHGLSTQDTEALSKNPKVQVKNFPALFKAELWANPSSKVVGSPAVRAGLRGALDNAALTQQIFGPRAVPSTQVLPNGMLPDGAAPDAHTGTTSTLDSVLASKKGQKVVIGWYSDGAMQQLADLLQVRLKAAGLNAVTREYKPSLLFALPTKPDQRPDLLAAVWNPDSVNPNTFPPVYWTKGAPVNLLGCTAPKGDALTARSTASADPAQSEQLAAAAARAYGASNCWLNISDVRDTIVGAKGLTGWTHELPWVFTVQLSDLKRGAGA